MLKSKDIADMFGVSQTTIYNWELKGILKDMMIAYYGDDSEYKYSDITEFYCSAANVVYWCKEDQFGVAPKTFAYFTELFEDLYRNDR